MMESKFNRSVLGVLAIFVLFGCDFQGTPVEPIIVSNIDTEFSIRMHENLSPNGATLYFEIKSIEEINCLNGIIDYSVLNQKGNLDLLIKKVIDPADCSPGMGFYHSDAYIGKLETDKIYNLTISLQNIVDNKGFLTVDDEKYSINLNTLYGLKIENAVMYKIPPSLVWGYIAIQNLNEKEVADTFLAELSSAGTEITLKQGDYGSFQVLSSGRLVGFQTEIDNPITIIPISFGFTGDWTQLTGEVAAFRNDNPNVEVKLFNATGGVF